MAPSLQSWPKMEWKYGTYIEIGDIVAVATNALIAISFRLKIKQVKLKSSTSQAGSAAESNKALEQPRSLGPTTKTSNPRLVDVPWMAEILHQLIGKFTVSICIPLLTGDSMGLIHPCINFSRQHYAVCTSMAQGFKGNCCRLWKNRVLFEILRWHVSKVAAGDVLVFWEGCGCDDWRRWSNLRSSPLVVQPTAAFDLFVPWLQKWRDLPGSNQWNSDQHKFRKQKTKETQTSKVLKKKSTSLSSRTSRSQEFSRKRLGSEVGDHSLELVHLYSTAESSPALRCLRFNWSVWRLKKKKHLSRSV